jgi:hypothetical protein
MPTNTEIQSSIVAGSVPPDRNCPRNGQEVVELVQDFCSIQNTNGDASAPDNSIAEQALNTANTALAEITALQAGQKQVRSMNPQPVSAGDSQFNFALIPPMPSTDYDVQVTYYAGASTAPGVYYNARVLESSMTVNGLTLLLDNTPANTKVGIRVTQR